MARSMADCAPNRAEAASTAPLGRLGLDRPARRAWRGPVFVGAINAGQAAEFNEDVEVDKPGDENIRLQGDGEVERRAAAGDGFADRHAHEQRRPERQQHKPPAAAAIMETLDLYGDPAPARQQRRGQQNKGEGPGAGEAASPFGAFSAAPPAAEIAAITPAISTRLAMAEPSQYCARLMRPRTLKKRSTKPMAPPLRVEQPKP